MLMAMSMLMLMMPDYATCRLCERLKGQARGVASEGLSLGFLGLATWSESVLLFGFCFCSRKSIAAKYPSCSARSRFNSTWHRNW